MMSATSIEKLCRICIKASDSYSSIYEKYIPTDFRLFEVINNVCQLDIHVDDGLPESICYDCHNKIAEFHIFKKKSHESQAILKHSKENFQEVNVKTEEMTADTNLGTFTSVGGIHTEEPDEVCAEMEFCSIKLEYDDAITNGEIGALTQRVAVGAEKASVLRTNEKGIVKETPTLVKVKTEELTDDTNLSTMTSDGVIHAEEPNDIFTEFTVITEEIIADANLSVFTSVRGKHTQKPDQLCAKERARGMDANNRGGSKQKMERTGQKPFACNECEKKFSRRSDLGEHKMVHSGEKPFVCDECGKKFVRKTQLRTHKMIHSGEKPFACDECHKKFSRKSDLGEHKMVHSGEKPFVCDECGKKFIRRSHLLTHKMMHRGEKPFGCDECDKRFSRRSDLGAHKKVHSGEKPYVCDKCDMKFSRRSYLEIHRKVHS